MVDSIGALMAICDEKWNATAEEAKKQEHEFEDMFYDGPRLYELHKDDKLILGGDKETILDEARKLFKGITITAPDGKEMILKISLI